MTSVQIILRSHLRLASRFLYTVHRILLDLSKVSCPWHGQYWILQMNSPMFTPTLHNIRRSEYTNHE